MYPKERINELREASGNVNYSDSLTSFLYILMRDYMPAGKVEELVLNTTMAEECLYTNGWLAQYANNLADKINNAKQEYFKSTLEKAFEPPPFEPPPKEEDKTCLTSSDFSKLEKKLREASDEIMGVEKDTLKEDSEEAIGTIRRMVSEGLISKEDGLKLESEVKDAVLPELKVPEDETIEEKWKNTNEELQKITEEEE